MGSSQMCALDARAFREAIHFVETLLQRRMLSMQLGFVHYRGLLSFRIEFATELAFGSVATACCAMLAAIKDDL